MADAGRKMSDLACPTEIETFIVSFDEYKPSRESGNSTNLSGSSKVRQILSGITKLTARSKGQPDSISGDVVSGFSVTTSESLAVQSRPSLSMPAQDDIHSPGCRS